MSLETALRGRPLDTNKVGQPLTVREWQILTLAAQGFSNKEMGQMLGGISSRTCEIHRFRVVEKLRARNTAHAVAIAITQGITSLDAVIPEEEFMPKRGGRPPKARNALEGEDALTWLKMGGRLS